LVVEILIVNNYLTKCVQTIGMCQLNIKLAAP